MYQQQKPPSEHSGLAVVLGWIGGISFSIWAWPYVDPLIRRFLAASIRTIGKDIAALLYFVAPFALFLLVLWFIMFFVDEVVIHNFKQDRAATDTARTVDAVFNGKKGWSVPWYLWLIGLVLLVGALGDKT